MSPGSCAACGHMPHNRTCFNMASDSDCNCRVNSTEPTDPFTSGDRVTFVDHDLREPRCRCQTPDREIVSQHGRIVGVLGGSPPTQLLVSWELSTRDSYVDTRCVVIRLPDPTNEAAIERWLDQTS